MTKTRYFIEHLPKCNCAGTPDPHRGHCQCQHRTAAHTLARKQHWVRVDDNTTIGIAEFKSDAHLTTAKNHSNLAVMPHLHDSTTVKSIFAAKAGKEAHFADKYQSLQGTFGVADDDTVSDMLGKLLASGHVFLEPDM